MTYAPPMSVKPTLLAEAEFGARASVGRVPGAGWLVTKASGALVALDDELVAIRRFERSSAWRAAHGVMPSLERAIYSERDRIVMADHRGRTTWEVTHHPWGNSDSESGSCWVSGDGRLVWATVPSANGSDQWWVLDAANGRVLDVAALRCHAAGSHPVPHPDGTRVGLSVGEGQDGSAVYWGRWDGRVHVSRLDARDRVLCDVRPDGTAYLATPHGEGPLTVHGFPTGDVRATRCAQEVFGDDEGFEYRAGYVTNELVIVGSADEASHALLSAERLDVIAGVDYPSDAVRGGIVATGRGTWLTSDWSTGRCQLWRCPRL